MKKSILVLIAVFAIGLSSYAQTTRYIFVSCHNKSTHTLYITGILSCDFEEDDRSYKDTNDLLKQFDSYMGLDNKWRMNTISSWALISK